MSARSTVEERHVPMCEDSDSPYCTCDREIDELFASAEALAPLLGGG